MVLTYQLHPGGPWFPAHLYRAAPVLIDGTAVILAQLISADVNIKEYHDRVSPRGSRIYDRGEWG